MQIVDAQIHDPLRETPLADDFSSKVKDVIAVECAREALDCVGVDAALVFASQRFIDACVMRYPERFAGVRRFDYDADDLEEQIIAFRNKPGMVAARSIIGEGETGAVRPDFCAGKMDPLYELAEKHGLPLFISTSGWTKLVKPLALKYPGLKLVIDHIGLRQSPPSPPRPEPWAGLPDVLKLKRYPNVYIKLSGVPLLSVERFPFKDTWPYLHRIVDAFGPERIMWASDFTRMRWQVNRVGGVRHNAPRSEWKPYSDCLNFIHQIDELSSTDKNWILGETAQRVLNWPS